VEEEIEWSAPHTFLAGGIQRPVNVQTAAAAELTRRGGIHLGEQRNGGLANVHVNVAQNNRFQALSSIAGSWHRRCWACPRDSR
jgi:hypothetical protein